MWPFNIFFRNEKKGNPDQAEYDISRVKDILAGRTADREKSFIESAIKGHSEILSIVGEAESELEKFDNSQVGSEQMDVRLHQILTGNKNTISKKLHELCKKLRAPLDSDINSIMNYYNGSYNAVSETVSISIRNYQKIEDHLDKQIIPVFRKVNYVAGLLESFKKEIELFQLKHAKMKSLENLINKFEIQLSNKESVINKKLLLEKEIKNLMDEKSSIEIQLDELINTNKYREFSKLIDETEVLKRDLDKNTILFLNYMSVLGRPIKKFMKLVGDKEVAFEQEKDLSDFLDNQKLTRTNILLIQATVEKMGSVMEKLNLKEENRTKTLSRMKEVLDGKILDELYEEKLKIENKLKDVENLIILRRPDKKFELKERIDKTNSDIGSGKNDLMIIEKDATRISKGIEDAKQRLEYELKEIFNEDVHIKIE